MLMFTITIICLVAIIGLSLGLGVIGIGVYKDTKDRLFLLASTVYFGASIWLIYLFIHMVNEYFVG